VTARRRKPPAAMEVHKGHDWLYVLDGRLRLVLGEDAYVLDPGEAAEFTTWTQHWCVRRIRSVRAQMDESEAAGRDGSTRRSAPWPVTRTRSPTLRHEPLATSAGVPQRPSAPSWRRKLRWSARTHSSTSRP